MEKKPHWASTPEGRDRLRTIQKKLWKKKKSLSRGELVVKNAITNSKKDEGDRFVKEHYRHAVDLAVNRGEVPLLMSMIRTAYVERISHQLMQIVGGEL